MNAKIMNNTVKAHTYAATNGVTASNEKAMLNLYSKVHKK